MDIVLLTIATFLISILTFFSSFGLGTLLTPIFMFYVPVELAILFTGIVHFLNNIFKIILVGKFVNRSVLLHFGLPAILFALPGSYLLLEASKLNPIFSYMLMNTTYYVYPLKAVLSILLLFFAFAELSPSFKKLEFGMEKLMIGGALSGFFGGLSGVQGAFRSAFLIRAGLSKEEFISTTVLISTLVDITRLSMYYTHFQSINIIESTQQLVYPILAALLGSILGNILLKKVKIDFIQILVAILLGVFSIFLGLGII